MDRAILHVSHTSRRSQARRDDSPGPMSRQARPRRTRAPVWSPPPPPALVPAVMPRSCLLAQWSEIILALELGQTRAQARASAMSFSQREGRGEGHKLEATCQLVEAAHGCKEGRERRLINPAQPRLSANHPAG